MCAAGDNAYEQQSTLVDERLGHRLVQSLIQCRLVYEKHGFPTVDKFSTSKHNPDFRDMADALKGMFKAQGLPPYSQAIRAEGTVLDVLVFINLLLMVMSTICEQPVHKPG